MLMARAQDVPGGDVMQTYDFSMLVLQDGNRLHYQIITPPLAAGNVFTPSTILKCQILGKESAVNDNIMRRVRTVKVTDNDGIDMATLITFGDAVPTTEWNTALRNLSHLTGEASEATYTTALNDRLKIELGHRAVGGTSVIGSTRLGFGGGTGYLG